MDKYIKNGIICDRDRIIIYKNKKQIIGASDQLLIEDGWKKYQKPEPTQEQLIANAKEELYNNILSYDSSEAVNEFSIHGDNIWLDKVTRSGLMLRLNAEKINGLKNTTLWYGNKSYTIALDTAMQILYAIELYASACYDNTQKHLANIEDLETLEDIQNYDYTLGYPNKLVF